MGTPEDPRIAQAVARFFESRRSGRHESIDQSMAGSGVAEPSDELRSATVALVRARLSAGEGAETEADPSDDLPEIPGYDVVALVGRGGMGEVYEAFQRTTGRRVAIKLLGEGRATASLRRRFEREVELAARLQHPGIVAVIDADALGTRPHCVMEFVEGQTLNRHLKPGECGVRAALEMMATICEAVDYAHQRGVLHRDLKPSNILVDARGQARVLDFGLAKAIDPMSRAASPEFTLSEPGQVLGTLAYMPPEQARGRPDEASVRSDVYSLGAVAYELLTGRFAVPIDGALGDVLRRIEQVDPARPSSLRAELGADVDAIVLKCLEKSPARRYATAGELAADIRRFLESRTISARRVGTAGRLWRLARRNAAVTMVSGVALSVLLVVGVTAAVNVVRERDAARRSAKLRGETLERTLEALGGVFFDANDALGATLGAGPAREVMLRGAMPYFDRLADDAKESGVEGKAGPIFGKLGDVLRERGEGERAAEFYRRSLAIMEEHARSAPGDVAARRDLGFALARAAWVEESAEEKHAKLRRAVRLFEEVWREQKEDRRAREELIEARLWLAESGGASKEKSLEQAIAACALAEDLGNESEDDLEVGLFCVASIRRAAEAAGAAGTAGDAYRMRFAVMSDARAQRLAARWPDDARVVRAQISALAARARLALGSFEGAEREERFAATCELADRLVLMDPANARSVVAALEVFRLAGTGALHAGEFASAVSRLRRAESLARRLFESDSGSEAYRETYTRSLVNLAAAELLADSPAAAADAYRRYVEVTESADGGFTGDATVRVRACLFIGGAAMARDAGEAAAYFEKGVRTLEAVKSGRALSSQEEQLLAQARGGLERARAVKRGGPAGAAPAPSPSGADPPRPGPG